MFLQISRCVYKIIGGEFKMGMLSVGLILGILIGGFAYMVYDLYLKNKSN